MVDTAILLCAGDSLTEGTYGESYVSRLASALGRGELGLSGRVINAGRGGDTVYDLLVRLREPLRQHRPSCVLLAVGVNDVWLPWLASRSVIWWLWLQHRRLRLGLRPTTDLDRFAALYRDLITLVREEGAPAIVACTTSCCGERLSTPVNRRLAGLNGVIKRVALDCRVPLADVWQAFVDELTPMRRPSPYVAGEMLFNAMDRRRLLTMTPDALGRRRRLALTFDGLHLNSRGADLWARTILTTLTTSV